MPVLNEARCQLDNALEQITISVDTSQNRLTESMNYLNEAAHSATKALNDRLGQFISGSRMKATLLAASGILVIGMLIGSSIATFSMHRFLQYQQLPDASQQTSDYEITEPMPEN